MYDAHQAVLFNGMIAHEGLKLAFIGDENFYCVMGLLWNARYYKCSMALKVIG